jgi:hypothetical protein
MMSTDDAQQDEALQYALEELQDLAQKNGLTGGQISAYLAVMNIFEVLDYLDAKMANRLQ